MYWRFLSIYSRYVVDITLLMITAPSATDGSVPIAMVLGMVCARVEAVGDMGNEQDHQMCFLRG